MGIHIVFEIILGIFALVGFGEYIWIHERYLSERKKNKQHEDEMGRKIYETQVLAEIEERVGYSLNALKIVEIISGSIGNLLPYSAVSYMVLGKEGEKITFSCRVNETVSRHFVGDLKVKMLAAFGEMLTKPLTDADCDESVSGTVLSDNGPGQVKSYFNVPVVILDKVYGIINVATAEDSISYDRGNTDVFYRIAHQASEAVSKLESVLENEKARLLSAVQALADGLMMVDVNYHLVLVNKKLTEILGIVAKPSLFDIVNALSGKLDLRTKMEEVFTSGLPVEADEIAVKDRVFQVLISKVLDRRGEKPIGIVVLFHDITDTKSIEKLRRDFTAMMVHELRSPLTSIKATVEMILPEIAKMSPEEISKNLKVIDSTSSAMLEVVNDLLDVAKLEAGKFDVVCDSGDITEAIQERIDSIKAQADEKKLKLTIDAEENLPKGYFDKIRIKQVLNNLLSNALKFTDRGEIKVHVKSEKVGGMPVDILVAINDTGIGIEPDQINTLFSKFKQLRSGRANAGLKSSGLGLFIAKGIVSAWGGKIWGESQGVGMGSTFYFTVPLATSEKQVEEQIPHNEQGPIVKLNKVAQA